MTTISSEKNAHSTKIPLLGYKYNLRSSKFMHFGFFIDKISSNISLFNDRAYFETFPKKYNTVSQVSFKDVLSVKMTSKVAFLYLCYAAMCLFAALFDSLWFLLLGTFFVWLGLNKKITITLSNGQEIVLYEKSKSKAMNFKTCLDNLLSDFNNANFNPENELSPSGELFDLSGVYNYNNDNFTTGFYKMCEYIDTFNDIATCYDAVCELWKKTPEWATKYVNKELYSQIYTKIKDVLDDKEELIAYVDSGIVSKGNSGIALTTKKIIKIKRETSLFISLSEIWSIGVSGFVAGNGCNWHFNSDKKIYIDNIGCPSQSYQSALMALICLYIKMERTDGAKIKLVIQN